MANSDSRVVNFFTEWNKDPSLRQLPWCVVSASRLASVAQVLELLTRQLRISDAESARLWAIEIDGTQCRRLLDNDSMALADLKIEQNAQVNGFECRLLSKGALVLIRSR